MEEKSEITWLEQANARRATGEAWDSILPPDDDPRIRIAFKAASQAAPEEALPILAQLARHPKARYRREVAQQLGRFRYSETIRTLLLLLSDSQWQVREAATAALGRQRSPETIPLLRRMMRDPSRRVRLAVSEASLFLARTGTPEALALNLELLRYRDVHISNRAIEAIESFQTTPMEKLAAEVRGAIEIHGATAATSDRRVIPSETMLGPDTVFEQLREGVKAKGAGSDLLSDAISWARGAAGRAQPRSLYGWWGAMIHEGVVDQGNIRPEFISCHSNYKYRYRVALSPWDLTGAKRFGSLPEAIDSSADELYVALLADNEHLTVEDQPPVKRLQLPSVGASDIAEFTVRGLQEGPTWLQVLVYCRGSLVLRGITSVNVINAPGRVRYGEGTDAATILSYAEDVHKATADMHQDRFASFLIERDSDTGTLTTALFYQGDDGPRFTTLRIPAGAEVDFDHIRNKLLELVEIDTTPIPFMHRPVFLRSDFELKVDPASQKKALAILREIGTTLWVDWLGSATTETQAFRQVLQSLVQGAKTTQVLQIVSDDLFIPWQLLYIDDGSPEVNVERFWGMRFQIEHALAEGDRLHTWQIGSPGDAIVAYLNMNLPADTLARHAKLFPNARKTEKEVLADFSRADDPSRAIYFYCHAELDATSQAKTWLQLTDEKSRLTLRELRNRTLVDGAQNQLVFQAAPLVFLNACESGQVGSSVYRNFVSFLLLDKKAGGVVGAETKMPAYFATDFAESFWNALRQEPKPVAQLLFELRRRYWKDHGNPLGLLYSLYTVPAV